MIGSVNYLKYFKDRSLDTVPASFYAMVRKWDSWYRGNVSQFHRYRVHLGKGTYQTCKRRSLGMAKKLCEDMADFLLNERVMFVVSDPASSEYVRQVLDRANFRTLGNEYQERKAACGTVAYVPFIRSVETDGSGNVVGGRVDINYIDAQHIFPTAWENGRIVDVAFAVETKYKGKRYALIQMHELDGGQYVITNTVVDCNCCEVPESTREAIQKFRGLPRRIETGSDLPQFVIDRLAIVNNVSQRADNPMGIPIFANAIDILEKIDIEFDSYANEFLLGRKRLLVAPEMMQDENGNLLFDPVDGIYYCLPEDFKLGNEKAIEEIDMTIRSDEHAKAIDQDLNLLSLKCGFGTQYYKFDRAAMATATQVISDNSDLYRTIRKHETPLEKTVTDLVRIILRLGVITGRSDLDPETAIAVDFDDSIIEDATAERKQDREDVAMGAMTVVEYRAKWYGETEDVARTKVKQKEGQA